MHTAILAFCLLFNNGNIQCDAGYSDPMPSIAACDEHFRIYLPRMTQRAGELAPTARIFIETACPAVAADDPGNLLPEIEKLAKKVSATTVAARDKGI